MYQTITTNEAKLIFGDHFFGGEEHLSLFGSKIDIPDTVPLTEKFARSLASLGFDLFFVPHLGKGEGEISSSFLMSVWEKVYPNQPVLYDYQDIHKWYKKDSDSLFYKEYLPLGWMCMLREPLTDSYFSTYKKQTEILAEYLEKEIVIKNSSELEDLKLDIQGVLKGFSLETFTLNETAVVTSPLNQKFRSSFVEELYRIMIVHHSTRKHILEDSYTWTNSMYGEKEVVRIGAYDDSGADVTKRDVFDGNRKIGLTSVIHLLPN